jgi:uncharacterized membrane protein YjgN (DUF898 family)
MSESYQQYQPAPYGQPNSMVPREHPQGTLVLVLGILGVFVAGICAPFAWYLGGKALKEGRAAGITYSNQQQLVVGRVLGIIMTLLAILAVVFGLLALVLFVVAAGTSQ